MLVNLRNIFTRMDPTKQDMHTLHGVVMAIAEGRKGPAKGGVLDGEQATRLRALLAEHGQGPAVPGDSSTVRGLARLLRRNPTDAERILWQALTRDRRFAGQFKRQTPVGRHIPDFVSFVHRLAIELVNANELEAIVADRAGRKAWLEARDYRVIEMRVGDVEADLAAELARLEAGLPGSLERLQTFACLRQFAWNFVGSPGINPAAQGSTRRDIITLREAITCVLFVLQRLRPCPFSPLRLRWRRRHRSRRMSRWRWRSPSCRAPSSSAPRMATRSRS